LEKRILEDLQQSGFPLEVRVALAFSQKGWNVGHQAIYVDEDERRAKYVDILAHKGVDKSFGRFERLTVTLVCECKKTENPWVFYTPPFTPLEFQFGLQQLFALRYMKVASFPNWGQAELPILLKSHYLTEEPLERFAEAYHVSWLKEDVDRDDHQQKPSKKRKFEGPDQISNAINQVLKATNHNLVSIQQLLSKVHPIAICGLFYPVIVVDGPMYEYGLNSEGNAELRSVSYLKCRASIIGQEPMHAALTKADPTTREFLIDIVREQKLGEYITSLDKEIESITK